MEGVVREGAAILRFKTQKVSEVCDQVRLLKVGTYNNIPIVNCPYIFASDAGDELLVRFPDAPFAGYYFDRGDSFRQWGLRSRKDFDCSVVAKSFGGGGHAQASGFQQIVTGELLP